MSTDTCDRCGETFQTDEMHLELAEEQVPPNKPPREHVLCPSCTEDFRQFLRYDAE